MSRLIIMSKLKKIPKWAQEALDAGPEANWSTGINCMSPDDASDWRQDHAYESWIQFLDGWGVPDEYSECVDFYFLWDHIDNELKLYLWILHPHKGAARGVEIYGIKKRDLPMIYSWLRTAADRNASRFADVVLLASKNSLANKNSKETSEEPIKTKRARMSTKKRSISMHPLLLHNDPQALKIPAGGRVVEISERQNVPTIWVEADITEETEDITVRVVDTGYEIHEREEYLGTSHTGYSLSFHIVRVNPVKPRDERKKHP